MSRRIVRKLGWCAPLVIFGGFQILFVLQQERPLTDELPLVLIHRKGPVKSSHARRRDRHEKIRKRIEKPFAFRRINQQHNVTLSYFQPSLLNSLRTPLERLNTTWVEAASSRQEILALLKEANVHVDLNVLQRLPYQSDVSALYGAEPVVIGMETCKSFRDAVSEGDRFVGVAGQMNVGTNALGQYMQGNLKIPANPGGVLREVPWSKHSWSSLRNVFLKSPPQEHRNVMPIVVIRDPFFWMKSMCLSPYTMEWEMDGFHCPNLVQDDQTGVPVHIRWGKSFSRAWPSLAHVWSSWYREYIQMESPRLIVRMEDLLFHTPHVLNQIRECVGATWVHDTFQFVTGPAKTNAYFTHYKPQVGLVGAMLSYGQDLSGDRVANMTTADLVYAKMHLDRELMEMMHYHLPVSTP